MSHLTALKKKFSKIDFHAAKTVQKRIKRTSRTLFSNSDSMLNRLMTPNTVVNDPDTIRIGDEYHAIVAMTGIPGTMKPNWLHDIVNDTDGAINFSQMIVPIDNTAAETKLNATIRRLETGRELARIEKRQFSESESIRLRALKERLNLLVGGKEKSFQVATYFNVHATKLQSLERQATRLESLLGGVMILHDRATYQNIAGHEVMMPICTDNLGTSRSMDTTSLALTIALPGQARINTGGDNAPVTMYEYASKMPIHHDRFAPSVINANMAIFASSGAGKTVTASLFIIRDLGMGRDVVIIDPKGEYGGLIDEFNGTNIEIREGSKITMNPFQLGTGPSDSLNTRKQGLPAFFEMMIGTISDAGFAILEDCVNVAYLKKGITDDRSTWDRAPPIMSEFYEVLYSYVNGRIEGAANFDHSERVSALALARKIKRFATGTYRSFFDGQSTIDFSGRLINYDISAVPKDVQNAVMYLIMSQMYDYMSAKQRGSRTLYIDEAWAILASNAEHVHNIMKTCRSRRMGVVPITQDLADVMKSGIDEAIMNNVGTHIVMKMAAKYGNALGAIIGLTEAQSAELPRLKKGEGYIVTNAHAMKFKIPVSDRELNLIESSADFKKQAIGMLDLSGSFYRCKDLSPQDILWATDAARGKDRFTRYNREKTLGRGTADYLIKTLPKNQSAGHYIVVKLIADLADSMGLSTTINDYGHDFDVVIENANSFVIGIEVETGRNKRDDVLTKVDRLNTYCAQNDGIDWWFVTPGDKRKEYAAMHAQTITSGKVESLLSDFRDKGSQLLDQNNTDG